MMRLDGAVHVWSDDLLSYPWSPHDQHELPAIAGSAELLMSTLGSNGFDGAICVQPRVYGYDHGYLIAAIKKFPGKLAGICLINPVRPGGQDELANLVENHGISGVRLLPLTHVNPRWFVDESGDHIWSAAGALGIPVSVLVNPNQIEAVKLRARQFPSVSIVIDHLGLINSNNDPHLSQLLACAVLPNVFVKISSQSYFVAQSSRNAVAEVARATYSSFGPERVIFGTDWPYSMEFGPWSDELELLEYALGPNASESLLRGGNADRLWKV
jgi:predicted TIM-barrel fold metal-dependent hydrolase